MSKCSVSEARLRELLQRHPGYSGIRVFVETGTYLARTTMLAHQVFAKVFTIEISEALYRRAVQRYAGTPGVTFARGDSRGYVQRLAQEFAEPVFWFLDAHWFSGTREPVGGAQMFPLWDELDAIGRRPAGDIVLIDDVHVFGQRQPQPEWAAVSLNSITARLPGYRVAEILGPHAVVYR